MALKLDEVALLILDPSDAAQALCKIWLSYLLPFGLCSAVKAREEDNCIMTIFNESWPWLFPILLINSLGQAYKAQNRLKSSWNVWHFPEIQISRTLTKGNWTQMQDTYIEKNKTKQMSYHCVNCAFNSCSLVCLALLLIAQTFSFEMIGLTMLQNGVKRASISAVNSKDHSIWPRLYDLNYR